MLLYISLALVLILVVLAVRPWRFFKEPGPLPMEVYELVEFDDYDAWLQAARSSFPDARHNKKGKMDWVPGYGEEDDEEFVAGPDLQTDVVAAWCRSASYGWVEQTNR